MIKWTKEYIYEYIKSRPYFDIPTSEEELKIWEDRFKDYPYELTGDELDPNKIWDRVIHPSVDDLEKETMIEDILRSPIFNKK